MNKNIIFNLFVVVFLLSTNMLFAGVNELLPKPKQIGLTDCGGFVLNRSVKLEIPHINTLAPDIDNELVSLVTSYGGNIDENATSIISVKLVDEITDAEFQEEAYSIQICMNNVNIKATTMRGAYWAVQTLWQLAEGENNYMLESCQITDWAAFRIRGYMHDIGRSYIEFDELKNEIVRLSRFKINTFHWHLTDNQGWRLESKVYPQLNANSSYSRFPGKYYTLEQAKELVIFAKQHGVTIIPEIDMPGHSEAFRKAMGHSMLTNAGLTEMKAIMTEACSAFENTPWMHIGSDEVRSQDTQGATITPEEFITQMTAHIHSIGKKIVVWNPGHGYSAENIDMTQMWSSRGAPTTGIPAIDSRYHYVNHYDQFADVVSLYNSTIAQQQKGSEQYAGTIIGIWNDRILPSDEDIIVQNAFYQSMLAIAERAWIGGGKGYFTEIGTTLEATDVDFMDWERRFLFYKSNFLQNEPIAYVKQTNVKWRITDQFPNGGDVDKIFPPETELKTSYEYNGKQYNTSYAIGAGIYLRHVWGGIIPTFYDNPQPNHTAYAYTYVYSPAQQEVGLQVEFQNYGRSEKDLPPPQGKWDYNNSKIWVNDVVVNPPQWQNTHTNKSNEITLKNENFPSRNPIRINLNEGWNKVLIKLPNKGFSINQVRLVKWMFTCVFTTTDGNKAIENLVYSPDKNMKPSLDILIAAIENANKLLNNISVGEEPGYYSYTEFNIFKEKIQTAVDIRNNSSHTDEEYRLAAEQLIKETDKFKKRINLPLISNGTTIFWYSLSTPNRTNNGNNYVTFKGDNIALKGESFSKTNENQLWKFTKNTDGSLNIIPKSSNSHIDNNSEYNTAIKAQVDVVGAGWYAQPIYSNTYFIIKSGNVQLNQTSSGLGYAIYNWGGGNNKTDAGCVYEIKTVLIEGATAKDNLQTAINNAYGKTLSVTKGEQPGEYSENSINNFIDKIKEAEAVLNDENSTDEDFINAKNKLFDDTQAFLKNINLPLAVDSNYIYWYKLTSKRGGRSVAYQGSNAILIGENYIMNDDRFMWKLIKLNDNSYSLVNKTSGDFITPSYPKLKAVPGSQTNKGWQFIPLYDDKMFIITSGTSQFNQGNPGSQHHIFNWGNGTNKTDQGCQYLIELIRKEDVSTGIDISVEIKEKVWVENRFLYSNIPFDKLKVYTLSGYQLSPINILPQGIIIVKTVNGNIFKLMVK